MRRIARSAFSVDSSATSSSISLLNIMRWNHLDVIQGLLLLLVMDPQSELLLFSYLTSESWDHWSCGPTCFCPFWKNVAEQSDLSKSWFAEADAKNDETSEFTVETLHFEVAFHIEAPRTQVWGECSRSSSILPQMWARISLARGFTWLSSPLQVETGY